MPKAVNKLNRAGIADVFGVSLTTVDAWIRAGMPVEQRAAGKGKPWRFDAGDVMRWREKCAADAAAGKESQDIPELRLRKLHAETRLAEIQAQKAAAMVAPVAQIERALSRAVEEINRRLRGDLVSRLASRLTGETNERTFKLIALAEVDDVLRSLADLDINADEAGGR